MIIASFTPYFLSFFQFQYVVLQLGNADGYRQPAVAALLYWPLPLKQRASLASVHGLISLLFFDPGQSPPRAAGTASFEDGRPFPLGKPSAYQSGDKPRYGAKVIGLEIGRHPLPYRRRRFLRPFRFQPLQQDFPQLLRPEMVVNPLVYRIPLPSFGAEAIRPAALRIFTQPRRTCSLLSKSIS